MQNNSFFHRSARLLLAVLLFVLTTPTSLRAADEWSYPTSHPSTSTRFGGGNGTKSSPYLINTAQHLANLAYMVVTLHNSYTGCYFKLTSDIVLNDNVIGGAVKEENGSIRYNKNKDHFDNLKQWQPIGIYGYTYDDDFEGIFDGGGHTISGVYCREPLVSDDNSYFHTGLFGNCKYATIMNLTIKDSFYSICLKSGQASDKTVGSLVGLAKSTNVANCHTENCVISSDGDRNVYRWAIGGLVGEAEGVCSYSNCSFDGVIDVYASYVVNNDAAHIFVGGLIGSKDVKGLGLKNDQFVATDCRTSGKIFVDNVKDGHCKRTKAGGIIGNGFGVAIYQDPEYNRITRCLSRMDITAFTSECNNNVLYNVSAHGIISGSAVCKECASFGNITVGTDRQTGSSDNSVGGICEVGQAVDCFCYGDLIAAAPEESDSFFGTYMDPWISTKGTVTNSFAYIRMFCRNIQGFMNTDDVKYNSSIYDVESSNGIKNSGNDVDIFTSRDYMEQLNQNLGAPKYGLIKEDGYKYNGYLSLTSLGAVTQSLAGAGTEEKPYIVSSANDLRTMVNWFTLDRDFSGQVFKLATNIDMSNEPELEAIGSVTHPFNGIFDGNGHYIRGLRAQYGYLFGCVTGTVKNLALDEFESADRQECYGIAYQLGKPEVWQTTGTIDNCYVTGNANLLVDNGSNTVRFGGICGNVFTGAIVSNCYYVGTVKVSNPLNQSFVYNPAVIGGIANSANGRVENCYAAFSYDTDDAQQNFKADMGGIICERDDAEGVDKRLSDNYFCCTIGASAQKPDFKTYDGATEVADESKLDASALGSAWKTGRRHPVLNAAYHYDCKDYNGNDAALDVTGYAPTNNDILTLVPTADQMGDAKMWQMPNVAIYNGGDDTEYISGFSIIPDNDSRRYPLHYRPSKEGVAVSGLVTYPWTIRKGLNWRSFCLPGAVSKGQLPEGSKMYVGGTLIDDGEETQKINIVEVEEVPAGVPFFVRYDNPDDEQTFYINMAGTLAMTPQKADPASSLEGTYGQAVADYMFSSILEAYDGSLTLNRFGTDSFQGFVAGKNTGRIDIIDYLLLSEGSDNTDEILANNNGKTLNVKLRRNIRTGGWNTLCLPFGVSGEEVAGALGSGTRVEELASVSYDATAGAVVLKFKTASAIEAGHPYLVLPESEGSIFDLGQRTIAGTVEPATFSVTLGDGSPADISMVGSFARFYLASTDDENQYFIQQDKFYRATQANPITSDGYRCYFSVKSTGAAAMPSLGAARVVHADGTVTNIRLIDTGLGSADTRIYDIQGRQHTDLQRGVNIVGGRKIVRK